MAAPTKETGQSVDTHLYADDNSSTKEWMYFYVKQIRDCSFYKQEYDECSGWRGRLNQRYVYGGNLECDHWKQTYGFCKQVKQTGDERALENVVQHELARRKWRLSNARANDIWEYRTEPPEDWLNPVQIVTEDNIDKGELHSQIFGDDKTATATVGTVKDNAGHVDKSGSGEVVNVKDNAAQNDVRIQNNNNNNKVAALPDAMKPENKQGSWCSIS